MRIYTLLAASLAFPMAIASAQTQTPTQTEFPYIPLFGSSVAGQTGTPTSSTWFIDRTRNLVVFCTQSGSATTPTLTCTAQNVPTSASGGGSSGGGATGGGATGGGATGGTGDTSAGILRNPFSR
jgi:hypothetical protein